MGWSRIIETPLGQAARAVYESDPARHYHNWTHVQRLYWHAEHTFSLDYDADLDHAILAHDVIYDAAPDKEIRSAAWLADATNSDTRIAQDHILKTINHIPTDDNRMVLLDLADFLISERIAENLNLIALESCALYGITEDAFFQANATFMAALRGRILDALPDNDPDWTTFQRICTGIDESIARAKSQLTQ